MKQETQGRKDHSQANQPSSSSRLEGAGSGAPDGSVVGSCTKPLLPNGFKEDSLDRMGVVELVVAGRSGSLRDQPNEFMELRNEVDAMMSRVVPSLSNPTVSQHSLLPIPVCRSRFIRREIFLNNCFAARTSSR